MDLKAAVGFEPTYPARESPFKGAGFDHFHYAASNWPGDRVWLENLRGPSARNFTHLHGCFSEGIWFTMGVPIAIATRGQRHGGFG